MSRYLGTNIAAQVLDLCPSDSCSFCRGFGHIENPTQLGPSLITRYYCGGTWSKFSSIVLGVALQVDQTANTRHSHLRRTRGIYSRFSISPRAFNFPETTPRYRVQRQPILVVFSFSLTFPSRSTADFRQDSVLGYFFLSRTLPQPRPNVNQHYITVRTWT